MSNDTRRARRREVQRNRSSEWREVVILRPYSSGRKLRVAVSASTALLGVLVLSMPAWLVTASNEGVVRAIVGGAGAVILSSGIAGLIAERLDPVYDSVKEAFEQQLDPDSPDNIRAVIHHEVSLALAELADTSVDFGPRAKLFSRLELASAEEEILIQGISLSQKWQMTQLLEELFTTRPDFTARILLLHPFSELAPLRDRDLGFRPGTIRQLVDETIVPLASLRRSLNLGDRLQVRGYFAIPYYGFTVCDRRRLALSLSREERGGDQNMGIYVEATSKAASALVADLVTGFESRWNNSSGLLDSIQIQFSPGSEYRRADTVSFAISSDRELDVSSIIIYDGAGAKCKVSSTANGQYSCEVEAPILDRPFVVAQAISADNSGWLRNPVEIQLPKDAGSMKI